MNLNEKQLAMVDAQIKRLIKTDSYYGKIYRDAGIDGVSSQEDFEKLPLFEQGRPEICLSARNTGSTR